MPVGPLSWALMAGPPSPENPLTPVPAKVMIRAGAPFAAESADKRMPIAKNRRRVFILFQFGLDLERLVVPVYSHAGSIGESSAFLAETFSEKFMMGHFNERETPMQGAHPADLVQLLRGWNPAGYLGQPAIEVAAQVIQPIRC